MNDWHGEERRKLPLSEEHIEIIAQRAAEKALDKVYTEVGKAVLKKTAWVVGIIVISLFMWLSAKGHVNRALF